MAFEWDAADRAAFDEALVAHVLALYPEAWPRWSEYGRRITFVFPDGGSCSIWEPNFFFSHPSFPTDHLFGQVATWIAEEREGQCGEHTAARSLSIQSAPGGGYPKG